MEGEEFRDRGDGGQYDYGYVEEVVQDCDEVTSTQNGEFGDFSNWRRLEHRAHVQAQIDPGRAEVQVNGYGDSDNSSRNEFRRNAEFLGDEETVEVATLVEEVQGLDVSEAVSSRVKVAIVFSPMLFIGEDLYQQKRVRTMMYRYDDSHFRPIEIEDLSVDMIVLVVDDDGVDFQRVIVSEITRVGISVDGLDYFGLKEVTTVYECPEEIQEEKPAVRKYTLKAAPVKAPLMRGRRLKLMCDSSDRDYVEAEIVE